MGKIYRIEHVPPSEHYAAALATLALTEGQKAMLNAHRHSPGRVMSAGALARAAGHSHHGFANNWYGRLAHAVADSLGIQTDTYDKGPLWTTAIAEGWTERVHGTWCWRLYPEVCMALDAMDWRPMH